MNLSKKKYRVTGEFCASHLEDPTLSRVLQPNDIIFVYDEQLNPTTVVFEIGSDQFQAERKEFSAVPESN